ncbi:3-isopropylmalate dehydrogenase [Vibrio nigripulchritudo SO65]|uniref:isocitrate/isopropylmalate dehydrogenase family protein n=1 Tax=Vibrio nigripulchritudo TaxID=28173 RepID=UPI0003B1FCBC|nr:isocitrate/isopropylmalate family dehydrogenase [Vibrio nigripulchritudo]CCN33609.1 3-isopropylmalate dehydrogenase [Vibrio nigripulchritudo AM115]CCN44736.1 3-isopropylmalate dehydrogenase [Vibrio nigripulchritudo FTn2]CCN62993.1 3-isopropylmalate dehydrogenase [Vibrio nigripulchritudo POn4]CCN75131.1 3-isopropylmalate dehydrogenase [Vibrio nigripulchritudo SO65]
MKTFHIAVMPGDGIGTEVTPPAVELVKEAAHQAGVTLTFEHIDAGAEFYDKTGDAFPEEHYEQAIAADAIFLSAMGRPDIRYPDGTEIGPQHDLRKRLNLYAGVRPCRTLPGLPLPLEDIRSKTLDFVIVRESTEGLFAFPRGHEMDNEEYSHNLMRISRTTSQKLFDFSFKLARRRASQGKGLNLVTHIDKANVLSSQHQAREWFYEVAEQNRDVDSAHQYVDFAALDMVRRPWQFDVMPTENQYGDILSDIAAGLMGGMGMAPSGEIGDTHAVFQPCHGSAPDIMGQGKANPTAMILSGVMMLDYLGDKHTIPELNQAAAKLDKAVENAYRTGSLLPYELGGKSGLEAISTAVEKQLAQ